MKNQRLTTLVVAVVMFSSLRSFAGDVRIIVNPSVKADAISAQEIKSVFLLQRISLRDGTHVDPVLSQAGSTHASFLKNYLGQNDDALQNYYRTLVFTGKGSMPKALHTDEEVVAYVAKTRGAIGYVGATVTLDGVKTLAVYPSENDGTRRLMARVEPVYPPILRTNHIGGTVRLKVTIASNGTVEDVELLGGNPILGEAAMAAVKQWIYTPGRSRTTAEVSVPFDANR
jgi:TonB family protein